MLRFFSDLRASAQIDAFARDLAEKLNKRVPRGLEKADPKVLSKEFEIALGHAKGFERQHRLGTFGKSRLANAFRWALVGLGCQQELAERLGNELAIRLAQDV